MQITREHQVLKKGDRDAAFDTLTTRRQGLAAKSEH